MYHNVAGSSDEACLAGFLVTFLLIPRGRHVVMGHCA